ncbi:hypothetical protein CQ056_23635 [Peribacillus simplex]|nr:hypothetical protein CQ056_23635 [Peribacillus simplex]
MLVDPDGERAYGMTLVLTGNKRHMYAHKKGMKALKNHIRVMVIVGLLEELLVAHMRRLTLTGRIKSL